MICTESEKSVNYSQNHQDFKILRSIILLMVHILERGNSYV